MSKFTKQSPLQIVNERFGSKQELAKRLADVLEPVEGESKDELVERLTMVSNSKLLHLQALAEKVTTHGGREGLVQKVAQLEGKTADEDYLKALTEKRTLGWLVDRVEMHEKRSKRVKQAG